MREGIETGADRRIDHLRPDTDDQTAEQRLVYIKIDGDLEYGRLTDPDTGLYHKIRGAGIENIAIITEKKTEKG